MSDSAGAGLPHKFSNDGSFMEQFLQMQMQQQQQQQQREEAEPAEEASPSDAPAATAEADDDDGGDGAAAAAAAAGAAAEPAGSSGRLAEEAQPSFAASSGFAGARAGYVFTTGADGTGYYRDTLEERMAEAAKPRPVVLRSNNPIIKIQPRMAASADSRKRKLGERCLQACWPAALCCRWPARQLARRAGRAAMRPRPTRGPALAASPLTPPGTLPLDRSACRGGQ
jgi:hypothetical protein